jgi:hypothetical protein
MTANRRKLTFRAVCRMDGDFSYSEKKLDLSRFFAVTCSLRCAQIRSESERWRELLFHQERLP